MKTVPEFTTLRPSHEVHDESDDDSTVDVLLRLDYHRNPDPQSRVVAAAVDALRDGEPALTVRGLDLDSPAPDGQVQTEILYAKAGHYLVTWSFVTHGDDHLLPAATYEFDLPQPHG